jgi:hypothetical protein
MKAVKNYPTFGREKYIYTLGGLQNPIPFEVVSL